MVSANISEDYNKILDVRRKTDLPSPPARFRSE